MTERELIRALVGTICCLSIGLYEMGDPEVMEVVNQARDYLDRWGDDEEPS